MKLIFLALLIALVSSALTLQGQKHSITTDTIQAGKFYKQAIDLQKIGRYDSSTMLLRQAIILYKKHSQWEKKLDTENKLSFNLAQLGQYEQAVQQAEQTLAETRANLRKGTTIEASTYNNLGILNDAKGEYDKALEYHQKALQIRISELGEWHPEVARTYNNIGIVYEGKGEYDKAIDYHQQAVKVRITILGEKHPDLARSYNNIGNIYQKRGEHDKALGYYQRAVQIFVKSFGEPHPLVANSYSNIGNIYERKGEHDEALEYYQKAMHIFINSFGENHPNVGRTYNNIGIVYEGKGEYDKAIDYHQQALQLKIRALGENHPDISASYDNIGLMYQEKGDYHKALEYFQKSLKLNSNALGKSHPYLSSTYNSIGLVYWKQGAYIKALSSYQQAIMANVPAFQDTLVNHNPYLGNQIGLYLDGRGLLTSLLGKARVLTKLLPPSTDQNLLAYHTLCLADSLALQVTNSFSGEQDKVTFLSQATQTYQLAFSVCLKLQQLTGDKSYLGKAFYFVGRGKASILFASIAESKAKSFAGIADSLLEKDQRLRANIAYYTQKIGNELYQGKKLDSVRLNDYQNKLFTTYRQQDSLVAYFEKHYPKYYELKYKTTVVTPQQLQQQLDDKIAVVEYVVSDSTLHLLTLTRHNFDIQSQRIDSSFTRLLKAFGNSMRLQQQDVYEDVAYKLYQRLWPKNLPAQIKQVILIPDGVLATIPFEALVMSNPAQRKKRKPAYLVEKYTINYAYSASLLYENLTKSAMKANKHLLALAPVFADTSTNTASVSTRDLLEEHTSSLALAFSANDTDANDADTSNSMGMTIDRDYLLDGRYVSALPASEKEVQALDGLFKTKKGYTKIYLHQQAKEELLKSKELSSYNYLHLATHGFVDASRPELSGLLLAQDSTSEEDGILYAGEIYNLNLQAELVTLSACETGLGKLAKGEGIIGLTRALLYAGASNVAVSLWKVADESTSELMQAFYKRMLNGESKANALQGAKLEMLATKKYTHPYFWAPFILIGR